MKFPLFDHDLGVDTPFAPATRDYRANSLSVMLKPPVDLAERLWRLPEASRFRPADMLHTVIQPIGDRSRITDAGIAATARALSRLRHAPFLMMFDRIEGGDSLALSGGDRNLAAQDFRLAVLDALCGSVGGLTRYDLHPHMTLNYRGGTQDHLLDQPIAWMVEEFALVESTDGDTRHVEWGRWRLCED